MNIVHTTADYDICEYPPGENAPLGYEANTGNCYQATQYANAQANHTYRRRTPLIPHTQIKVWAGLVDAAVVEGLMTNDATASSVHHQGTVENATKLTLTCGLVGVHKPAASDDAWTGTHWAEIAAYQVDRAIGLRCVPITVLRAQPSAGSFQLWVDGLVDMADNDVPKDLRFFDKLIANSDRGNVNSPNFKRHPQAPTGQCVAFDNGCSFNAVLIGLADEKLAITPTNNGLIQALATLNPATVGLPGHAQGGLTTRIQQLTTLFS